MTELKKFNRNVEWLKVQSLKTQPEAWGSYEDAAKIIARSKEWFKLKRLGGINKMNIATPAQLIEGKDWRLVGNRVEFRLQSVQDLKEKISTRTVS